ncbi:FAD-binding protein [Ponticoccus sp. SC2-23]|uniref:FAD-binding oxidoreductase n=1 Tax=Alexandriicola marinus TaxID=2081710 RepID=UPI000FDCD53E|nr:FAD-linked oxidase C-terminal domain-containing protein [Alexandriicola marinus]MBM1219473.1 FAD-binding protein [Ponticoccus sp. SC6-9]MBM1223455.1 FAD-binding protein [Ponticoccus sp. SC6-15]MBM1229286.1 FAD-binding protein [Ponticoccus sp. SC6-38]MBM1232421.1 FAD-binding protein [Ponticoccus sp. SC6-45]MBM1237629.1 FAD-binding protein [Ponticoccus sp. SC6-49]MBM1241432.1 FAD-binding protein [Ponticoccus sp. SC2-64]MBM1245945.1 FAD-binding protein [Ponticoccus sp. SC6-42]MBM1250423.1 F
MSIETALMRLSDVLGDRLSRSKADLDHHGQSETHFAPAPPDGVAWPETTAEVAEIARICSEEGCPIIGWGAGTSLEGHALATEGGLTVDFGRMNRVLQVNAEDMDVVVQPGVTRRALNEELRATGLFFPVDPGADASLGGMAMTRASGTTAVRYGTMRDNVRALEVVLADGRVIRTGSRARKSSAGYDLTGLFVGSEGTLGLVTELTLRLYGQPEAITAAVCAFDEMGPAVDAVTETIQSGVPMARIEFIDAPTVRAVNVYSGLDLPEMPHLMVEFHGSETGAAEDAERFAEIAQDHGAKNFERATRTEDRTRLWRARHDAYWAILAAHPGRTGYVTDVCVPITALAEAVAETEADIAASGIPGPIAGHVGDGNFHSVLLVDPDNPAEHDIALELSHKMAERALRLGGTVTGEHGVGLGKRRYMAAEHGDGWAVMGDIKRALDPGNLMNPGKLVPGNQ